MPPDKGIPGKNIIFYTILIILVGLALYLAVTVLLPYVIIFLIPMGPGYAPPSARARYLIPVSDSEILYPGHDIAVYFTPSNGSKYGSFYGTHASFSPNVERTGSPFFPHVSGSWSNQNYTYNRTGDRFLAETWYFTDGKAFADEQKELVDYLKNHGSISGATLVMDQDALLAFDPGYSNSTTREIPVTVYTSDATSGYFFNLARSSGDFSDYYIVYYGVMGPSDLSGKTPLLKLFFVPFLRTFDEGVVRGLPVLHSYLI